MTVHVAGMYSKLPADAKVINVCSNSGEFYELSPFVAGPVPVPNRIDAVRMENAWQFSKVYGRHIGKDEMPNELWYEWSEKGYADAWAHRYPMGKGAIPAYTWWHAKPLGYIEARKQVYAPLYARAIMDTDEFAALAEQAKTQDLWLRDYDGYVTQAGFEEVLNDPSKKMGHAFVIKALVERDPALMELLED